MKFWLILLISLNPWLVFAETTLPYKPTSRVSDLDEIFDPKTREFISQTLQSEFTRNKISVYVVAMSQTGKGKETATANRLRDAWIREPLGLIILYNRASDEISISLTDKAYKSMAAGGRLELVANQIDEFNLEGPSRGMPKVVSFLLERVRLERKQVIVVQQEDYSHILILIPFCILLGLLGLGMFRFYRYMETQNVFNAQYQLKSDPVKPVLGSSIGGINTAEGKF